MNEPSNTVAPQPDDMVVSFCYGGQLYQGVLRPSGAATWQLLVESEWWGDLSYEEAGYRFVDLDGTEQPFTIFENFATLGSVPAQIETHRVVVKCLELRFSDDRLHYRYQVVQKAVNRDWEVFSLKGKRGSEITVLSERPFVRRTRGRSAAYTLRLSNGQQANEGFLELLFAHLRTMIRRHFET